ncbi:serine/threonine protein phosphatase 2A 57 kDa regulatory subunit B' kappa isoform [Lolium perenne]|uniref:serine/threonine protein phosphatase 2A 57 kDa regulatory subunit B' kappa isoform n=1 Tax=Lolium perenne TaxID=4522 RepID=UPI0021F57471|nr:serine/threonine protein phosphatase 2A 57 kDa regulatory subunit B' kappa isoform [Lolium perenne]
MWKQFLSKLPRTKSTGAGRGDDGFDSGQCSANNAIQRATSVPSGGGGGGRSASAIKRMSSAVFPSSVVAGIEPLVAFKDVPSSERQSLFVSKLGLCCAVFDFTDPSKSSAEKDIKRQALLDLIDFVDTNTGRFSEAVIAACARTLAVNLFRVFPPSYRSGSGSSSAGGGEGDEDEPTFDPAWCHLQLVYELLLKFVGSNSLDAKLGKKYFDHSFIVRLLNLLDSEDPRERDALKTILHRIYGKFMVHRPFIRKAVSNIFYHFVFETQRHNGVAELLEVFGSVISGFALPLKEEHKIFLWKVLIPLHKPKSVGVYLQQLTYCVTQFLEKDPKLAGSIVLGILRYWPVTNSQKEVMFLSEIEEILEATSMVEFQKCMVPLFRRIAHCINSSHFQVAERALFMWNNDHIISLIAQNRQAIMPIIVPALQHNSQTHWNHAVLNLTANVMKVFSDVDDELCSECLTKYKEDEENQASLEEKRRSTWARLESAAALQPVTGHTAVLVG